MNSVVNKMFLLTLVCVYLKRDYLFENEEVPSRSPFLLHDDVEMELHALIRRKKNVINTSSVFFLKQFP